MRKVLVIAFDFPPRRTSGVYRPTGLVKFTPTFGWQPTVLTVEGGRGSAEDPELLRRVPPEVKVVRTRWSEIKRWETGASRGVRRLGGLQPRAGECNPSRVDKTLRSLAEFVRSCLYFPDETAGWIPFALAKAWELHFSEKFDIVYSTYPPRSGHAVAWLLKSLLRIPWVAEFRDPWYLSLRPWRRAFDQWLESSILRRADGIVVVTDELAQAIKCSRPEVSDKIAVISNGFDEEDFDCHQEAGSFSLPSGYVHFSHFGTIYSGWSGSFFPALAELLHEQPNLKGRVRVNIFGFPDEATRGYCTHEVLRGVIQLHGFLKHSDAISAMRSSACLLLFLGEQSESRLVVSGKMYEYLRVGRPILAVAYEGGVKRLVEEGKAGWVVSPDDVQSLKRIMQSLLSVSPGPNSLGPPCPQFVAQFRYDNLARKLAGVFDKVTKHVN